MKTKSPSLFAKLLTPVINLLLYGHFWIALAALLMTMQTTWLLTGEWQISRYEVFVACGTMAIYALHRMVALWMHPSSSENQSRYKILDRFKWHILAYALISGAVAAYLFFTLSVDLQRWLLAPCAIALGYVLPLMNGKRLRDFPFLKIFLIAFSWAWITVAIPVMQQEQAFTSVFYLMILERCCFIFAITIPFDIRDLVLDKKNEVETLPGFIGEERAKTIAITVLGIMFVLVLINTVLGYYSLPHLIGFILSIKTSAWLISHTHSTQHDYYFTGFLDGTMVFQTAFLVLAVYLFSGLTL